jgi:threonine/homoserine/homoserine lactone efflux protein
MDYVALTLYLAVMIITPGPNNIMVTASGANYGLKATLPHIFGIISGTSIMAFLCCFGLGTMFAQIPLLQQILSWLGLAYMGYLSWKMLGIRSNEEKSKARPITFFEASLFQLVNVKAWIINITVASVFLPKTGELIVPTIIIITIASVLTFIGTCTWAQFGIALRHFLKTERNQRIFNITMALLLLLTAILALIE